MTQPRLPAHIFTPAPHPSPATPRPPTPLRRFCNSPLADWKASLTPDSLKPEVQRVQPIMVVYFEGQIHR